MYKPSVAHQTTAPLGKGALMFVILLALGVAGAVGYLMFTRLNEATTRTVSMPWQGTTPKAGEERVVSELEIPVTLLARVQTGGETQGTGNDAVAAGAAALALNQPADALPIGSRLYALDSGNGRLVELDHSGKAVRALDASLDKQLALHLPMAVAAHNGRLYIADSGSHRVVVVQPTEGKVEKVIPLRKLDGDTAEPRPIGIVVAASGDVFVSDANNQRVIRIAQDGTASSFVGTGKRDAGDYGLNTPGGLSLDREGNLYVVDILNSRVVKYSPDGEFLLVIGHPGDTSGTLSRPKGVAVDDKGQVYVSDSLQAAVQVFDAQGEYVGLIGREEAGNKDSASVFRAPAELDIVDGKLYVTDRLAGLFVFELN
jgi:DNA-binding beta-propeller fold protein YncE